MHLHFELLLKNKYFDEAKLVLKHYQDLPYISQEVEEYLRDMPKRIELEQHQKNKYFTIDEINDILEHEKNNAQISEVLFSLKNYNLNMYIGALKHFMIRQDVNPNFRTFALILLVDNKHDEEVKFLSREGLIEVNAAKIVPPFSSERFNEITKYVFQNSEHNVTLQETSLHLVNCLAIDIYPLDLDFSSPIEMGEAFLLLGKEYIREPLGNSDPKIVSLKEKIQAIIEATPAIKM